MVQKYQAGLPFLGRKKMLSTLFIAAFWQYHALPLPTETKTLTIMIESAKLTFSRIGVHFFDGQPRNDTIYMPRIVLRIQGRKSGKTGYLAPKRFEKKDYLGLAILPDFIVVITSQEYIIVDEKVEEKVALPVAETGQIVGVQEEGFLCRKDNMLQLHDITGNDVAERELTEEEISRLGNE